MDAVRRYKLPHNIAVKNAVSLSEDIENISLQVKDVSCVANENFRISQNCKSKIDFWNLNYLDGSTNFDGSLQFDQSRSKTKAGTGVSSKAKKHKENIENATVTKTRNLCFFDGSVTFDGSKILNSIYEKEDL